MKELNPALLKKFLALASNSLSGEWVLIGGTLLPALGIHLRSTVDIDLVGLSKLENQQTLELMGISESLGLSVETINQAAGYFLNKIKPAKSEFIVLKKGKSATIYRPSLELFWKLKIPRLSEADLVDCESYFHYCVKNKDKFNSARLIAVIKSQKPTTHEKSARLKHLLNLAKSG